MRKQFANFHLDRRQEGENCTSNLQWSTSICSVIPLHAQNVAAEAIGTDAAMVRQWLVPLEKLILFQTLYFPIGLRMGRRLTSVKVAAS